MSADTGDILRLDQVGHRFGGLAVLRSVSFSVRQNGIVGLIGPNGSGKTTLFNAISGFLHPQNGDIRYQGQPLGRTSIQERSRRGMVRKFQKPKVFEQLTVLENIMVGCCKETSTSILQDMLHSAAANRVRTQIGERAEATLVKFGFGPLRDASASILTA